MGNPFESSTEIVDTNQPTVLPSAERRYSDPRVEFGASQILGSYFGGPGQPGLIGQQIPVPTRQVAGLSGMEQQARNAAGGLGGFAPQLNQAQQYYQQSAMGYNPQMAQSFMNPYQDAVIDPQMQAIQRRGDTQRRDARAQQVTAGAFGGSRGAVQEAEIRRGVGDRQAQVGSDLAYKGYNDAMANSMAGFDAMQAGRANAARGIAGLGQQGFDMLSNQIGTMNQLGGQGRDIQDRALGYQYNAATQMADEPYMRLQRGQQMLGGLAPLMPSYTSGFNTGQGQYGFYQDPSLASQLVGGAMAINSLF
tara:strand:+ start:2032 stop:2952 length:921 start_codon:yes stop_codon:yes gene_type:complete